MLTILDLPKEIILIIADYLKPLDVKNLKHSSSYFFHIFSDSYYWEHYARKNINEKFPPLRREGKNFSMERSLCRLMHEQTLWSKDVNFVTLDKIHCSSIDAVVLIKNSTLCISGSRDRTLALWDVTKCFDDFRYPEVCKPNSHNGWIWDLCENPKKEHVYSASWDKTVKIWDTGSELKFIDSLFCRKTVLSVILTEYNLIAVGLYDGTMQLFDPSTSAQVGTYSFHKKPIFEMGTSENYIFTASQDRKIGIFDMRNWQSVTHKILTDSLPLSLSVCSNLLYVGDSWGGLYLYDSQTFERVSSCSLLPTGRKRQITGIKHYSQSLVVTSTDGFVRVFTLTDPPKVIQEFRTSGEAISLDYKKSVIAVGNTNNTVNLLCPINV